jgi:hypothetical protein
MSKGSGRKHKRSKIRVSECVREHGGKERCNATDKRHLGLTAQSVTSVREKRGRKSHKENGSKNSPCVLAFHQHNDQTQSLRSESVVSSNPICSCSPCCKTIAKQASQGSERASRQKQLGSMDKNMSTRQQKRASKTNKQKRRDGMRE